MRKIRFLAVGWMVLAVLLGQPAWALEEPLDPEQAFQVSARQVGTGMVEVNWQVAQGYYLYRTKLQMKLSPAACKIEGIALPEGKIKEDENFGRMEVYRRDFQGLVRFSGCEPMELEVAYQGCGDIGVCFPPVVKRLGIALPSGETNAVKAGAAMPAGAQTVAATPPASDTDVQRLLEGGSLLLILGSFFGFGVALSLTPCVFPMIPILSGIIVRQGGGISRMRAAILSGVYVLGMALTYSLAGVAAGLSGTMLSGALQNAWVLGAFAALFVALSLSMFGLYEIQMPQWLQSRFSSVSGNQGGSLGGIALMGALSALIVGPCIAPPLAGALLYIAKTGDARLGGAALFVMALGMGLPLMLVGVFSREILPRAGGWMNAVTKGFGVALLATALWIVSPVLPAWLLMLLAACLLIGVGIFLHALDPLPAAVSGWLRIWKGAGVAMLVVGCALLIGLLGGSRDLLQPLSFLRQAVAAEAVPAVRFTRINSLDELKASVASASKPVLLDFYADWCVSCKEMEHETFVEPGVSRLMQAYTLLQVDMTANTAEHQALLKQFGLFGPPAILFFAAGGEELRERRVVGFQPPGVFRKSLGSG